MRMCACFWKDVGKVVSQHGVRVVGGCDRFGCVGGWRGSFELS